jgi:putative tryptophan/tyrosine transport system substrate-binding protein
MQRRTFITLLGGAAAWPLTVSAQKPAAPVIGFLSGRSSDDSVQVLSAFRQGLNEAGYVEGKNGIVEYRWAEGHYDRLPALAAALVRRQVDVIVATGGGDPSALAAKGATTTIPIVFVSGGDPVKTGLVPNFNQPGGNVTGVSFLIRTLIAKQFEVLNETVPKAAKIGFLVNPRSPLTEFETKDAQAAAEALGKKLLIAKAGSEIALEPAYGELVEQGAGGLLVASEPFFNGRPAQLVELAARHRLPALYPLREFTVAGGLMSYGSSITDAHRQVGIYTGRILKGEKPGDLPIQQVVKIELAINLRTAKALGITVPISLLGRADEVIE